MQKRGKVAIFNMKASFALSYFEFLSKIRIADIIVINMMLMGLNIAKSHNNSNAAKYKRGVSNIEGYSLSSVALKYPISIHNSKTMKVHCFNVFNKIVPKFFSFFIKSQKHIQKYTFPLHVIQGWDKFRLPCS